MQTRFAAAAVSGEFRPANVDRPLTKPQTHKPWTHAGLGVKFADIVYRISDAVPSRHDARQTHAIFQMSCGAGALDAVVTALGP